MSEPENIVIDKNGNEVKPKKINFFKKAWYSITKFEKYVEMSLEGTGRALKYLIQIASIFALIIASIGIFNINENLNAFVKNINENVPDFKYAEGQIALAETEVNKMYTINDVNLNYKDIIRNDSETNNSGIIILKDKVIQISKLLDGEEEISLDYDNVMKNIFGHTNVEITKTSLIEFLNTDGRTNIIIVNFIAYFILYHIIHFSSGLIYALVLAAIGYVSAKITKLKLNFSQLFAMSIYAFTLSNILNMIYFIVNYFTNITIKYFDVAYISIAYVYLIAVLFLMKNYFSRKQENEVEKEKKEKEADGQEQI